MVALFNRKEKDQVLTPEPQPPEAAIGDIAVPKPPMPGLPGAPDAAPGQPAAPDGMPMPAPEQTGAQAGAQESAPQLAPAAEGTPLPTGKSRKKAKTAKQAAAPVSQGPKSKARNEIEEVLSNGLGDVFKTMSVQEQQKFRMAGEEAAGKLEVMMMSFKANAKKVLEVIKGWLSSIPSVNKYFLEQESKLKTDEIMKLQRKQKKASRSRIDIK